MEEKSESNIKTLGDTISKAVHAATAGLGKTVVHGFQLKPVLLVGLVYPAIALHGFQGMAHGKRVFKTYYTGG